MNHRQMKELWIGLYNWKYGVMDEVILLAESCLEVVYFQNFKAVQSM